MGGDAGPAGSRGRAHTRQHSTSSYRQGTRGNVGSLQRAFKGGKGPFPSPWGRHGLTLLQAPEPTAYTCKPRLASPQLTCKGLVFSRKELFQQKAPGQRAARPQTHTLDSAKTPQPWARWELLVPIRAGFPVVGAGMASPARVGSHGVTSSHGDTRPPRP